MLMKNIELFDKLSIRLHNRILFIKDVTGSEEICCWSFYEMVRKWLKFVVHRLFMQLRENKIKFVRLKKNQQISI